MELELRQLEVGKLRLRRFRKLSKLFPDTTKVWEAFDQTMQEADKVFAEADRLFQQDYEKRTGIKVDVQTRRVRFNGRWKVFVYFFGRALEALCKGQTIIRFRHVQSKLENN